MRSLIGLLLPAIVAASPLAARAGPDPSQISIESVSFSGDGCPTGSVSSSFSDDKTIITLGFSSFQAFIGPGTTIMDHSKNCQLHLNLRYPGGFTFAVVDATYHGFALLDPGVTASFFSTYFFSEDAAATSVTKAAINGGGPWAGGQIYTEDITIPTTSHVLSPCGTSGLLNINNRISLTSTNPAAEGELTDDDATVAFTHQFHIQWFPC